MVKRKWLFDNESCKSFTEYIDLSKEARNKYAFEIRDSKFGNSKISSVVKQNWKSRISIFITAFFAFIAVVKFFGSIFLKKLKMNL